MIKQYNVISMSTSGPILQIISAKSKNFMNIQHITHIYTWETKLIRIKKTRENLKFMDKNYPNKTFWLTWAMIEGGYGLGKGTIKETSSSETDIRSEVVNKSILSVGFMWPCHVVQWEMSSMTITSSKHGTSLWRFYDSWVSRLAGSLSSHWGDL